MARDNQEAKRTSTTMNRRRLLLGGAGAGTMLLAGCSGGDGGDGGGDGGDGGGDGGDGGGDGGGGETTTTAADGGDGGPSGRLTMLTAPPGTQGNAMGNAMMSLVTQETDLEGSAQAGSGTTQNVIQVMRGEANLTRGVTSLLYTALQREDPINVETEYDPLQLTSHQFLRIFTVAKADSEYEYISDLAGEPIAVGPQPASFQFALGDHYTTALGEEYTPAYQAPNDMAPQLAAGNVKAAVVMNANGAVPSFAQQIISQNDVKMLGWKESTIQDIRNNPNLTSFMQPNSFWRDNGISQFVMSDETFVPSMNYAMISSGATSQEVVYTFLNTMFQNREQLPEFNAGFEPWTEASFWNRLVDERIPFHPGAAQLLRENDLWKDSFEEAEI